MSEHALTEIDLTNVVFVLVEPQNAVNIGSVVRAMMNMGLTDLRLVNPLQYDEQRIEGAAHRSAEFRAGIRIYSDLEAALEDVNLLVAASNRRRELSPPVQTPKALSPLMLDHTRVGRPAILFGREDWGLPNDIVQRCNYQLTIPTDASYRSLNLAQAALLVAYELREAAIPTETPPPSVIDPRDPPATETEFAAAVNSMLDVLDTAGFFKPGQEPAKRIKIERLLRRTKPLASEAGLLRAMGYVLARQVRPFGEDMGEKPGETGEG